MGQYHINTMEVHLETEALAHYKDLNGTETIHAVKYPYQIRIQKSEILIIDMQMV
jgi:hypothetical protein